MFSEFVAIDILALLLPTSAYLRIVEKLHPHEPVTAHLNEAVRGLSAGEREFVQARVRTLSAYAAAVEKALAHTAAAGA